MGTQDASQHIAEFELPRTGALPNLESRPLSLAQDAKVPARS